MGAYVTIFMFSVGCIAFLYALFYIASGKHLRGGAYRSARFDYRNVKSILANPKFDPAPLLPEMVAAYVKVNMQSDKGMELLMADEAIAPFIKFDNETDRLNFEYRHQGIKLVDW